MSALPVWNGTDAERDALLMALGRECTCEFDECGLKTKTCPGHHMLVSDQRALDGLLFMRRKVACLLREEFVQH